MKAREALLSITASDEFGESHSYPHKLASMDLEVLNCRKCFHEGVKQESHLI